MGRQYVRQSFSRAFWAAGDSPCASSTTLQCVVAKIPGERTVSSVALADVNQCSAGGILQWKQTTARKASLDCPSANLSRVRPQIDNRGVQFLWRMLSLRFAVVAR